MKQLMGGDKFCSFSGIFVWKHQHKSIFRLIEEKRPIQKSSISTDEAVKLFGELGMHDKERLFAYRRSSKVNIYSIGNYKDYFYGYMVPNTGYLKYFELKLYEANLTLHQRFRH